MSTPANPLSKYRSYSYYHVLAVCDASATADALATETKPEKWQHPQANNPNVPPLADTFDQLGPYAVKFVNEQQQTGKYCVLINGATDATFTIVRAKWTSATAAAATIRDQSTSIAIEGDMEISEPKGVVFLDVLVTCCLALGIDAANAVFVLKTFFVGYPEAQAGEIITETAFNINDIEPLRFICYDVTGSFAEAGGLYHMSFVALAHGASRLPQYSKSASGFSFSGGSLAQTVANLSAVVEQNYDRLFKCVEKTVEGTGIDDLITRVKYQIELDASYQSDDYQVTDQQAQAKDKVGCGHASKIHISANMSIEDALHLIMRQCGKVTEEMSSGIRDSGSGKLIRFEYKIHSAVESNPAADGKSIEYTVKYLIKRFMRPKDVSLFELAGGVEGQDLTPEQQSDLQKLLQNNTILFDYLYTGKNIDILEFDMKMNLGLAYLQIATINNSLKGQLQSIPSAVTHVPLYDLQQPVRWGRPTQIPVFFGTQVRMPDRRNKQQISENAEAGYTMNKHASIEVQDVSMKIHGNPRLCSTINRKSGPANLAVTTNTQNVPQTEADFTNWGDFPAFAKVNIKMPRTNDDIALFQGRSGTPETNAQVSVGDADFTRDFWFTGYYYVVGIEHSFDSGEFTQTLAMVGIPQSKAVKAINAQGQNANDLEATKSIEGCYESQFVKPCQTSTAAAAQQNGPNTSSAIALPVRPPANPTETATNTVPTVVSAPPTNLADTNKVNSSINIEQVIGWKNAKPEVKQAILAAADKHGVDSGFMVAMASVESARTFDPKIVNPLTNDATGLYQFINSAWFGRKPGYGVVPQFGKELGIAGLSMSQQDAARKDPRISSEAAALVAKQNQNIIQQRMGANYKVTAGDLYLAHFIGPRDAAEIIYQDERGNGNAPISTALDGGSAEATRVFAQNPLYRGSTTIHSFRATNARSLAVSAQGTAVVKPIAQQTPSPTAVTRAPATANPKTAPQTSGQELASSKTCPESVDPFGNFSGATKKEEICNEQAKKPTV